MQGMFEHQILNILQFPHDRLASLLLCLISCIQNSLHEVQEAGFRAIMSLALYIRMNSADPGIKDILEHLLTETMACLFIGGVDSESVSNACAAVHGLAMILPVMPSIYHSPSLPCAHAVLLSRFVLHVEGVLITGEIRRFMPFSA